MPKKETEISLMGAEILNLVTTGMYHTPLAIYREYIQNAADAIETSPWPDKGQVEISINTGKRNVRIRDNGPGLTYAQAKCSLIPVARSRKRRGVDRGFRGIGRLAGLAFADKITFRTRARGMQSVTEVTWDGTILRASAMGCTDPETIIHSCVAISLLDGTGWPDHFFEVEVERVARHAAGLILNRDAVRSYIGEVGPVPISEEFPFKAQVEELFANERQPLTLAVTIEGQQEPIRRRHGSDLKFSEDRAGTFAELQPVRIPAADSDKDAAIGWIAHSSYIGAIPRELGVRGLRLREGNIQIGGENVLDPLFPEERFNRWSVGELHIIDERILPNGRRDYFEPSPHMRQVENQLESIVQEIVIRCRTASSARNRTRKVQSTLEHMQCAYDLAGSGYLKAADARNLIAKALQDVQTVEEALDPSDPDHQNKVAELGRLRDKLAHFRPRRGQPHMGRVHRADIVTYQQVFRALTDLCPSPKVAKEMIEGVIEYT